MAYFSESDSVYKSIEVKAVAIVMLRGVRLVNWSALLSWKWQPIGISYWCHNALLTMSANNWIGGL